MQYEYKTSFDRSFRKLPPLIQKKVSEAIDQFIDFLDKKSELPVGLGFKQYGKNYHEIRADISYRILLGMDKDLVLFYFVGNHDDIRRYVSNN